MNTSNTFPNSNYGPAGFNDNNFNRRRLPSNVYPPEGGMYGNPQNRFNQLTTNTQHNMKTLPSMSNFDQAFKTNNPMIEKIDYTNRNQLIHNNVGASVLDETVVEYRINIDSLDRDINTYTNPFNFVVSFNAPSGGSVRTEVLKGGKLTTVNDYFPGQPGPLINKEFRNVKYIKLDSIVLPQFSNNKKDEDGDWILDPKSYLVDDRFVVLEIRELDDSHRIYSTSDNGYRIDPSTGKKLIAPKPFGIIFPDTKLGHVYYTGTPYNANKIFKNSYLGNLRKMSIKLYDSFGNSLEYDNLFTGRQLELAKQAGNPIPITDVRHPLNPKIQVHYTFIVGVVEGHVNTDTKLEI